MKNRILIVTTLFLSSVSLTSRADDVRVSVTHPQTVRSAPVITLSGKFVVGNEIAIGSPLQQQTVTAVFVEEGQQVEKNQLPAIPESPLQSASVRQQTVLAAQSQREVIYTFIDVLKNALLARPAKLTSVTNADRDVKEW